MPPAYVKAYAKRGKTDAADAEAIAEAVIGPTTRFVAVKYKAQQAVLMLHKTRDLLVHQRTMLINALWGDLGEFGIVAPQGPTGVQAALKTLRGEDQDLPDLARAALGGLAGGISKIGGQLPSTPSGRWGDGCPANGPPARTRGLDGQSARTQKSPRSPPWPWPTRPSASPGP